MAIGKRYNDGLLADTIDVRNGESLPWRSLVEHLRAVLPGLEGPFQVRQFPNGSANLTYLLVFGTTPLVLRRPPFGVIGPGAHDMRREHKVLSTLWRRFPPAPRSHLFCDDHSIVGSDFVIMEYRNGDVMWGSLPESMRPISDAPRRIAQTVVSALADLHALDPQECGLADLGRPEGFVERQVAGWAHRWSLVAPPEEDGLMPQLARLLSSSVPVSQRVSILHNDYKIDNCQLVTGDPDRMSAIFDWDMSTLGDPLVDLGTLLNYWPDPSDTQSARPLVPEGLENVGLPSRHEVAELYSAASGLDLRDIGWYESFACFKTAVVLQQLFTRWVRGESTDPRMAERGAWVRPMVERAASLITGVPRSGSDR